MATPESKVKAKVVKQLVSMGAYYFFPVTGGFGNSGVPDIVICHKGRFIGIECKAGKGRLTTLQKHNIEQIELAGGKAFVVNEDNVDKVQQLIEEHVK